MRTDPSLQKYKMVTSGNTQQVHGAQEHWRLEKIVIIFLWKGIFQEPKTFMLLENCFLKESIEILSSGKSEKFALS